MQLRLPLARVLKSHSVTRAAMYASRSTEVTA